MPEYPLNLDVLRWIFALEYASHFFRYLLIAGGAFLLFKFRRWPWAPKIQADTPAAREMRREFLYSLSSLAIFALTGVGTFVMMKLGWTRLYLHIHPRGWGYLALSTLILIFAHDTWFYWTHRAMHTHALFPVFHRVHHLSRNPTPWAAFAFHPLEAVVEAGIFPLIALVLPLHPIAALIWLLYMTVMNVLGHCGFEVLPRGFARHWLFRWHNTSTHHDMHHRFVRCNYGLYYNAWDRLMGTNHDRYEDEFDRVKAGTVGG